MSFVLDEGAFVGKAVAGRALYRQSGRKEKPVAQTEVVLPPRTKMKDESNDGQNQQHMNSKAGHVKLYPAQQPRYEQQNKEEQEHVCSPLPGYRAQAVRFDGGRDGPGGNPLTFCAALARRNSEVSVQTEDAARLGFELHGRFCGCYTQASLAIQPDR